MSWELEIHMIDVGQGESSLIIARETGVPNPQQRTMLIDGGKSEFGEVVNTYIDDENIAELNYIVISHYDSDHRGGIETLLSADNLYRTVETTAEAAVDAVIAAASRGLDKKHQIAAGAAAATAAMYGGYNLFDKNHTQLNSYGKAAISAGKDAEALDLTGKDDSESAKEGVDSGKNTIDSTPDRNKTIFKPIKKYKEAGKTAGIAAANMFEVNKNKANVLETTINQLHSIMKSSITQNAHFNTRGRYRNTNIIDTGDTANVPNGWENLIINGHVSKGDLIIDAPNLGRRRTSVMVKKNGDEMLWNCGSNPPILAPDGSPAIFLVAKNKSIWHGDHDLPMSLDGNTDSIGLVIRFNKFFYYTAGDLTSEGDIQVAKAIKNNKFKNPQGGKFDSATSITAFKCGHHGADTSTSQEFLDLATPSVALISCGSGYNHPDQGPIDRLHKSESIQFFYLTNCHVQRNHVPGYYHNNNQLTAPGNKSRVAGDNNQDEFAAHRKKGNIILRINTNNSNAAVGANQFSIIYHDEDNPAGAGDRTETVTF